MPKITGKLTDFGLDAIIGSDPKLTFIFTSEDRGPTSGISGTSVLANRPVDVLPEYNGFFEADLTSTERISPAGYYLVVVQWRDHLRQRRREQLPWKLYVPAAGGILADLLRVPSNPALVFTGPKPPANPSPGSWWHEPGTGDLSEHDGVGWTYKANLRGPAGYNAVGADASQSSLAQWLLGTAGGNAFRSALLQTTERRRSVDIRDHGAIDGAKDNSAAVQAAADAAAGQLLVIPEGLWNVDPVSLQSGTTVNIYGTLRLRDGANLPSSHGVLYAYGDSTARKDRVRIHGYGGRIDGNRSGQTKAFSFDMEGINFKYLDHGEIIGVEVHNCIESGIDLDNSTNCIIRGNHSHDNYGNGFHMSNGATDNLVEGNTAERNGFGNERNGFDQHAGSQPFANRNRYIGNRALGNYRNYKIDGEKAIFEGNVTIDGANPDIITADLGALSPLPATVRAPIEGPVIIRDPVGGDVVDTQARKTLAEVLEVLAEVGIRNGPVLIASDRFTRADGPLGRAETRQEWLGFPTVFKVAGNRAALNVQNGFASCYLPTGVSDVRITAQQKLSAGRTRAGINLRQNDTGDLLMLELSKTAGGAALALRKRVNGTASDLQVAAGFTPAAGRTYQIRLEAIGRSINAWIDDVLLIEHTLTTADAALFAGMNRHGLYVNQSENSDDGGSSWDDLRIYKMPTT